MTIQSVAPDIYQVTLPLPFALRHVHSYMLRGDEGWTIVDTGLNTADAQQTWQAAWAELGIRPGDIHQIVLTHSHPDHYGLAGWLQGVAQERPSVYISVREAELVRYLWQEDEGWADTVTAFWHNCGMSAEVATAIVVETNRTRQRTRPHPTALQTIVPGSSVRLGNREWQTIHSPGHSDGQLMFYDAADALLLCGDHVLQKITPNISRWPFAELDPLGRYLRSLNELAALPVRLALPGHGPLITDWQGRIQQLLAHHDERLTVMAAVVNGRATPYEISQRVFDFNRLSIHEKRFAVAETLAHLDYLVWQERITQSGQPHEWLYNSKSGKS